MKYGNLLNVLRRHAAQNPEKTACELVEGNDASPRTLTRIELLQRSDTLAAKLRATCPRGERALLLFNNDLEFIIAFIACLASGVIAVPLYPPRMNKHARRVIGVAQDCSPTVVLTVEKYRHNTEQCLHTIAGSVSVIYVDNVPTDPDVAAADILSDIAFLQYTSGSTSAPKGVMVSHDNLMSNLHCLYTTMGGSERAHMVSWLPLFHDMGLIMALLMPLYGGFPVTLLRPAAFISQPALWLRVISERRATMTTAPDFAWQLCAERIPERERAALDLSCLKTAINAAEPLRLETLTLFSERFAISRFSPEAFKPAYGMAEATLLVTIQPPGVPYAFEQISASALEQHRVESDVDNGKNIIGCGESIEEVSLFIVDPSHGQRCADGVVGEVWIAGPGVASGYWRQPELSREAFCPAPWGTSATPQRCLRSGDLGYLRNGQLFITGRLKDLMIVRGLNYYPQDIEYCVQKCWSGFAGCRGAAFQIEGTERLVVIQEVARSWRKKLDIAPLAQRAALAIAEECDLALDTLVVVAPSGIPLTSSGKIQRRLARQQWLAGELSVVAQWQAENVAPAADVTERPTPAALSAQIRATIASGFSIAPETIKDDMPFVYLGFNSLSAATLAEQLSQQFNVAIDSAYFYDYPTLKALAGAIAELTDDTVSGQPRGQDKPTSALAFVESLNDDDVDALINEYERL